MNSPLGDINFQSRNTEPAKAKFIEKKQQSTLKNIFFTVILNPIVTITEAIINCIGIPTTKGSGGKNIYNENTAPVRDANSNLFL